MLKIIGRTLIILVVALLVSGAVYALVPASTGGFSPRGGPRPEGAPRQGAPPQGRAMPGQEGQRPNAGGPNSFNFFAAGPVFTSFAAISIVTLLGVLTIRGLNGRKLATVDETGAE